MLKQPITFTDFNNEPRNVDLYFNLTEWELVDWQADSEEGLQKEMDDAVKSKDQRRLLDFIKDLVFKAYGERDKDGIHFNKSPEISQRFVNSAMYSPLLLSLFADEGVTTANFINGLMPADLVKRAMEQANIPNPDEVAANYAPDARQQFQQRLAEAQEQPQFNVAAPIGVPQDFQAPIPPHESYTERAEATFAQQSIAEEARPDFRVKEEPLDPAGNVVNEEHLDEEGMAEFRAWKARNGL